MRDLDNFRSRKIGFVFQSFYLLPTLTAVENVQIPMFEGVPLGGLSSIRRAHELQPSQSAWGIAPSTCRTNYRSANGSVSRLPGHWPTKLPYCSPTSRPATSIRQQRVGRFLDLFDQLHDDRGMTLIVITHSLEVAERAERIIWIRDGRVAEEPVTTTTPVVHQRAARLTAIAARAAWQNKRLGSRRISLRCETAAPSPGSIGFLALNRAPIASTEFFWLRQAAYSAARDGGLECVKSNDPSVGRLDLPGTVTVVMIIGIDLGTTNSVAAYMTADGPRLILNALGEVLTTFGCGDR